MPLRLCLLWTICLTLPAPGQSQTSAPKFLWRADFSDSDMVRASQIILIGQVKAVDFVGPVIAATDDTGDRGDWQLVKVSVASENVLKDNVNTDPLELFYYTSIGPVSGNWNSLHIDDRYVFFLPSEAGVLREVRDFWRSN